MFIFAAAKSILTMRSANNNIYFLLGEYIRLTFLSDLQKGEEVYPLIDESFILRFCHDNNVLNFNAEIRHSCMDYISHGSPINTILGFIGLQLYAASKMENAGGFSEKNYRDRICEILDVNLTDWDRWARENQDELWKEYYDWCERKGFIVSNKCFPAKYAGRYVQYPKVHSAQILNKEDLKHIAAQFVEKGLQPDEDLSEREFWKEMGNYIDGRYKTQRSLLILIENEQTAKKQIYQHFLKWDGIYYNKSHTEKTCEQPYILSLYMSSEDRFIEVTSISDNKVVKTISLMSRTIESELRKYYKYKHDEVILFKKNDVYDEYWEETRYLEYGKTGYALFEKGNSYQYNSADVVKYYPYFDLVKISYNSKYINFYEEKRPYRIFGGFKIQPKTYLKGASPLLELKKLTTYWVDGEKEESIGIQHYNFEVGKHIIKIRGYKPIEIRIEDSSPIISRWGNAYKWNIQRKKDATWKPQADEGFVVGCDFEALSDGQLKEDVTPLKYWCHENLFKDNRHKPSSNVTVQILNTK